MKIIPVILIMIFLAGCAGPAVPGPRSAPGAHTGDEAGVRAVVEGFGRRLQNVALLSPNPAQEIGTQYSGFVSSALLKAWMDDPSQAPGRKVSSPWPDKIEITAINRDAAGRYRVDGEVVEITSTEAANGGAADRIPVHLVVEGEPGHWLITEYTEER